MDPTKGPKTTIFPNALFFTLLLKFEDVFGRRSCPKRPQKHFFTPRPNPKVPIMRWNRSQRTKHPVVPSVVVQDGADCFLPAIQASTHAGNLRWRPEPAGQAPVSCVVVRVVYTWAIHSLLRGDLVFCGCPRGPTRVFSWPGCHENGALTLAVLCCCGEVASQTERELVTVAWTFRLVIPTQIRSTQTTRDRHDITLGGTSTFKARNCEPRTATICSHQLSNVCAPERQTWFIDHAQ